MSVPSIVTANLDVHNSLKNPAGNLLITNTYLQNSGVLLSALAQQQRDGPSNTNQYQNKQGTFYDNQRNILISREKFVYPPGHVVVYLEDNYQKKFPSTRSNTINVMFEENIKHFISQNKGPNDNGEKTLLKFAPTEIDFQGITRDPVTLKPSKLDIQFQGVLWKEQGDDQNGYLKGSDIFAP